MKFSKRSGENHLMSWTVQVQPTAEKYYLKLDKKTQVCVRKALENLEASDESRTTPSATKDIMVFWKTTNWINVLGNSHGAERYSHYLMLFMD